MMRSLLAFVFLASSATAAVAQFPLHAGDTWTYRVGSAEKTVSIARTSGEWFQFDDLAGRARWVLEYQGRIYVWDGRYVVLYDFARTTPWKATLSGACAGGTVSRAAATDAVVTPAGTFADCVRFTRKLDCGRTRTEWFAPGVGLVRWSETGGGTEGVLVEAVVGGVSYHASRLEPTTLAGMGAIPYQGGTAFRVWAPFADGVFVAGDFNAWSATANPLAPEGNGNWSVEVPGAKAGEEYQYVIRTGSRTLWRVDPRAREVTSSVGNAVIQDPAFDWGRAAEGFRIDPWNQLVIYEVHVGTFYDDAGGRPGTFDSAIRGLDYLRDLGVNAVEVLPIHEFPGDYSWGYNPAHPFAVESAYGGPDAFRRFVRAAHERGIAVLVDVVYNHFGPSDLPLWRFDGWSQNDLGGIYFYNDARARTPWGHTRPDYGRAEVRDYLADNAALWLDDYRADGLRWDSTVNIRTVENGGGGDIADGWGLMQRMNDLVDGRWPGKIQIAEDLQGNDWITRATSGGGAGFDAQWDAGFVHPVREAVIQREDRDRRMGAVRDAIAREGAFRRVVYTESHDEVANGKSRVPEEIWPGNAGSWFSRKRSMLGAGVVLTSPGIPMLFQGQELLEDGWFTDTDPVDWTKLATHRGVHDFYRDLVRLRRNAGGRTRGLTGPNANVFHVNDGDKVLAYHRWMDGGPRDDVVVVANFSSRTFDRYTIGFPRAGTWRLRLNGDWNGYGADFGNQSSLDAGAVRGDRDGLPYRADVSIGPYTILVFSQD